MAISRFSTSTVAQGLPKYQDVWDGSTAVLPTTGFVALSTTTVGTGGSSSVTFSSIPQVYKHLQIRYIVRNTTDAYYLNMRFNGDTGSNYVWHLTSGDGSSAAIASSTSTTSMVLPRTSDQTGTSFFTGGVCEILDYENTSKTKAVRAIGGFNQNSTDPGQQKIEISSDLWMNTSAVTSITLFPGGGSFAQYSQFALYGIQGA